MAVLRVVTLGSVDDGKSTLLGRLLLETEGAPRDQVEEARRATPAAWAQATGEPLDPSLLTDGLRDERAQGITIDVAWRTLSTARRRLVLADAPGHVDYLRNVVSGAADADVALLVVDAREGPKAQTRRHAALAGVLRVPATVVVVNKLDAVGWDRGAFERARDACLDLAARAGLERAVCLPVSALRGDNVARRGAGLAWWDGPTLLEELESIAPGREAGGPLRLPVQLVLRGDDGRRALAGSVARGVVRPGDQVVVLPARRRARVARVATFESELAEARAGRAVTVELEGDVDVARGDVIAAQDDPPPVVTRLEATALWFDPAPLAPGTSWLLRHQGGTVGARVEAVLDALDVDALRPRAAERLVEGEVGQVRLALQRPIAMDAYARDRVGGAFVLIDPVTNATAGAGVVTTTEVAQPAAAREAATVWLTGLPVAGKTTVARALEGLLREDGRAAAVLDGDALRAGLSSDLGYSPADRAEQVRRAAEVARLLNDAGVTAIVALVSPDEAAREAARAIVGPERFVLAWVATPLEACRARDPKGLYARAAAGLLPDFTGVSAPYEPPARSDVVVDTREGTSESHARALLAALAYRSSRLGR